MRRRFRMAIWPFHRHSLAQLAVDAVLVALAYFLAFRLRFDASMPPRYEELLEDTIPWVVPGVVAVFVLFGLYARHWRYTTQRDFLLVLQATVFATLLTTGAVALTHPTEVESPTGFVGVNLPSGVSALFFLLMLGLTGGARLAARTFYERPLRGFRPVKDARRVLIVGAGDGGQLVLREILRNPTLGLNPVGFVDDDPLKRGLRFDGVRVLGPTSELDRVLDEAEPDEITIAIPSAPGTLRAQVVKSARRRGIPVRTLPTVFELLLHGGDVVRQAREVQVEDILGREPVRMEIDRVGAYLNNEVVMVTGAGGSIGSELCRQIARVAPRKLVLLDHAEDNLFAILRELEEDRHVHPQMLAAVLADCKEGERMRGCSASTGRRSCSTPPPTSTSASWRATRSRRSATTRSPRGGWRRSPARAASRRSCSSPRTRRSRRRP
jgi:FlaA1/EpsC-like NDP-sugar epimerase